MHKCIYKESVELTSVYPIEGCGKTRSWTNGTIPHTRIDMGYRGTLNVPVHEYLYESECCPYHPHDLENFHIFDRGLAKNTFTICKHFSFTGNTHYSTARHLQMADYIDYQNAETDLFRKEMIYRI